MESNILHYMMFYILFVIGQSLVVFGSFISLPYKNLSLWDGIKMSLPFVWIDWIFMTFAIILWHKYSLLTNLQLFFTLVVFQFAVTLIITKVYLKQNVTYSDIFAFFLLIFAYIISEFHLFSKIFKLPIPEEKIKATTKETTKEKPKPNKKNT